MAKLIVKDLGVFKDIQLGKGRGRLIVFNGNAKGQYSTGLPDFTWP